MRYYTQLGTVQDGSVHLAVTLTDDFIHSNGRLRVHTEKSCTNDDLVLDIPWIGIGQPYFAVGLKADGEMLLSNLYPAGTVIEAEFPGNVLTGMKWKDGYNVTLVVAGYSGEEAREWWEEYKKIRARVKAQGVFPDYGKWGEDR